MEQKTKKNKIHFATLTIWAALMAAASLLPSFPVLGGGGTFSIGYTLAPLAGILFGPIPGALAALVGDFIGTIIAPHTANVGVFTCLTGASNALAAGFLCRKKWWPCLAIIVVGFINWMFYPSAREAWLYSVTVWGSGAVLTLVAGFGGVKLFDSKNYLLKTIGLVLVAYPGFIAAQAVNSIFVMIMYDLPADLLRLLAVYAPLERALFSVGSAIIGVPLLLGLPKIGVFVGPDYDNQISTLNDADRAMQDQYNKK